MIDVPSFVFRLAFLVETKWCTIVAFANTHQQSCYICMHLALMEPTKALP